MEERGRAQVAYVGISEEDAANIDAVNPEHFVRLWRTTTVSRSEPHNFTPEV